jgi:hypothetical protein
VDAFWQNAASNFVGDLACAILIAIATVLIRLRKKSNSVPRGIVPLIEGTSDYTFFRTLIAAGLLSKKI